ncbi:hypothetical protein SAMN05216223_103554 [Actinacidiphila yanglinensis]|uniref:Uncharacterized protein n=1 Tax=Actinacidiphila yanglinensis TaxID=310779 RepID=A0A1H5Y4H5_9ACTN|nr:hypothetical protein [Actinacidiphila yanglinensis]SEG18798.1 hypothetical protein SAMN05216223_103554 [Actinacidiphila yanglinensis]
MADTQNNDDDPDSGKDFSNLVPTMTVDWDTPPSFNIDPGGAPGGQSPDDVVDSGPVVFDAATVRATESTLLTEGRGAVSSYESLRQKVDAVVHGQFWGPAHTDPPISSGSVGSGLNANSTGGYSPPPDETDNEDQNTLADLGDSFAVHINPAMQKALALQSNALELLGNYLAMINGAGQSYGHVDRAARFPDPTGSVTATRPDLSGPATA